MKEEAIKLFCFVVKRTESGLSIEKALASLLFNNTGLIKATPSTLASEGKPDQSELSTNHSSSGLH